jgi:hypothetical protein
MRLEESSINPLLELFEYIETLKEVAITNRHIEQIGKIFNSGGVFPETHAEVIDLLVLFNEFYGLIEIAIENNFHYIRKISGKDEQQA